MRLSKLRNSSLVIPATSSADFASQTCIVFTDKHALFPLLMTPPRSICARNLAGTAMRPFASIVCSCSPRNIAHPSPLLQLTSIRVVSVAPCEASQIFSRILGTLHLLPPPYVLTKIPHFTPLRL